MKKSTIYNMATCAIMAAVMCVLGPLSIPVGPVPISLLTLAIYLAAYVLGAKGTTISVFIYILLGAVGLPVFSGAAGGLAKIAGPTGGYIVGYLFLAFICGLFVQKSKANLLISVLGMIVGTAVLYAFGTVWFIIEMKTDIISALTMCVLPFIVGDLVKIVAATLMGKALRAALTKANLLPEQY